jgi:hypothetical protein
MLNAFRDLPVKNRHLLLITAIWVLLVLYPNPIKLALSIQRSISPPVKSYQVQHLLSEAPADPASMERYVLTTFPYQYDWVTYGMPWYFPSVEEALAQGTGDCKTRMIVLASLFEASLIPYRQSFSLSHFWVHYEGKLETPLEMQSNAFLLRKEDGSVTVQVPREDREQIIRNIRDGFWRAMPQHRKFLLIGGPMTFLTAGLLLLFLRRESDPILGYDPAMQNLGQYDILD